jgi:putative thioredoxin
MTAIDVTDATFEDEVLNRSHQAPVVVDFWAGWCAPCRALGPVLEKLASEADGGWILAKVDVDSNPMVASGFGIQGIPAVKAFKNGKLVAEFTGALPEPQVRTWLQRLGPTPAELAFAEGQHAESTGDLGAAEAAYERALAEEPGHAGARMALARIRVSRRAEGLDPDELRARLNADPTDLEAATTLADLLLATGKAEGAFQLLLDIVTNAAGDAKDAARRRLIELLDSLPPDDPRAISARRALSRALF